MSLKDTRRRRPGASDVVDRPRHAASKIGMNGGGSAQSARKALEILLLFDERRPAWSVAEMARAIDLPLSSTYRYVATLRQVGLLEATTHGAYQVGERAVGLARAARAAVGSMLEIACPVMKQLRDECEETVFLVRRVGDMVICLDRAESEQAIRLSFDSCEPSMEHGASAGTLLVAAMCEAERLASEKDKDQAATADPLPCSMRHLDATGQRIPLGGGFEQVGGGIWGTSAPICDDGVVVAAIGVGGPLYRLDSFRRERIASDVSAAAEEIAARLAALRFNNDR